MVASFETIVGAANLDRSLEQTLDGVPVRLGVRPGTAEEVAACLAAARDSGAALVPTGGGSKLTQANVTRARSLVRLELSRLVEPLDVQLDEGIVTVGAGVRVEDLERAAREAGAQTRVTSLHPGATVGGTIAADPPDPECGLDRRLRSDLLGLTVALTNGELTRSGGKVVKNVTGLDLVRLYCGSCGTLGVITEATLRVWPLPEERVVLTRTVATLDTAIETARALEARRVDAIGLAILPDVARAQLVWTVEGSRLDVQERLGRIDGEQVGEEVWQQVRAEMASREGELGRARIRVSARPSDTQELVRAQEAWSGPEGLRLVLPAQGIVIGELDEDRLEPFIEHCGREEWAVFVERASLETRASVDVFGPTPGSIDLMRGLKSRFDPEGVLSPGRFIGRI